jgi:hypothetical protein
MGFEFNPSALISLVMLTTGEMNPRRKGDLRPVAEDELQDVLAGRSATRA